MNQVPEKKGFITSDVVVVKALEDGVTVIGLTRGHETRFAHSEKLDEGEVWISQFTELTSAMKVRGRAEILPPHGPIISGRSVKRGGEKSHEEG
ncbi:MAG: trp RNA-binding attenuation protein MtrB [Synergistales bacterium]|nr:trp RNA-binding attenuation protein MtrB [Synergistales bacterium]